MVNLNRLTTKLVLSTFAPKRLRSFLVLFAILGLSALPMRIAHAAISVSIGVGDTVLKVDGYSSPSAFVTIKENGSTIGTATSDLTGYFTSTLVSQPHGVRNIDITSATPSLDTTDQITVNVDVVEHATTQVTVFLPSTLHLSPLQLTQGQNVTLVGETRPSSIVNVYVDGGVVAQVTSMANGSWGTSISTAGLPAGTHSLYVITSDGVGGQSSPTANRQYVVYAPPAPPAPQTPAILGQQPPASTTPAKTLKVPKLPSFKFKIGNFGFGLDFGPVMGFLGAYSILFYPIVFTWNAVRDWSDWVLILLIMSVVFVYIDFQRRKI